jgi:hypothetical protein
MPEAHQTRRIPRRAPMTAILMMEPLETRPLSLLSFRMMYGVDDGLEVLLCQGRFRSPSLQLS